MIRVIQQKGEIRFEGNMQELRFWARDIMAAAEEDQEEAARTRMCTDKEGARHISVVVRKGQTVQSL